MQSIACANPYNPTNAIRPSADTVSEAPHAPSDPTLPAGMTWSDILNLRNTYARRAQDRSPEVDLPDLYSAGNEAIATLIAGQHPHDRATFTQWLRVRLQHAMWHAVEQVLGTRGYARRTAFAHTASLDDPDTVAPLLASPPRPAWLHVYLQEVTTFVTTQLPPAQREALTLAAEGYEYTEMAAALQTTMEGVSLRLRRGRKRLWAWAGQDHEAPHANAPLTPQQKAQVLQLRQHGYSYRAIQRRVGCSAGTIRSILTTAAVSSAAAD